MPLLETADSGKCRCVRPEGGGGGGGRGVKSQPGGAYNQVFDFGAPIPKEAVPNNILTQTGRAYCYHDKIL